jgi:hypothetical protein
MRWFVHARQVDDRGDLYEFGGSARRASRRLKYPFSANGYGSISC